MNYKISKDFFNPMLLKSIEPCVSIYMPTHRVITDNKKDILVFKNLAKEVKLSLEQNYTNKDISSLVKKLKQMEDDFELWNHSKDGLAIFASSEEIIVYRLEINVEPLAIVSNSFHIKPIVEYFQMLETFTILALESDSFTLYEGSFVDINPISLSNKAFKNLEEVLGMQNTENYQTHGSYGGPVENSAFHGHGGKSSEVEIDRIKYFRYVDKFVLDEVSNKKKLPLILVANKEHHSDFKSVSSNPYLLDESIDGNFESFKDSDLKSEIKKITNQRFNHNINKEIERYHNLKNEEMSSDQLIIVLKALLESRVEILMIEANKIIPGKIDKENYQIIESDITDPKTDDLLDDMLQHAFKTGTKVYILNKNKMPTESGVVGIFRF